MLCRQLQRVGVSDRKVRRQAGEGWQRRRAGVRTRHVARHAVHQQPLVQLQQRREQRRRRWRRIWTPGDPAPRAQRERPEQHGRAAQPVRDEQTPRCVQLSWWRPGVSVKSGTACAKLIQHSGLQTRLSVKQNKTVCLRRPEIWGVLPVFTKGRFFVASGAIGSRATLSAALTDSVAGTSAAGLAPSLWTLSPASPTTPALPGFAELSAGLPDEELLTSLGGGADLAGAFNCFFQCFEDPVNVSVWVPPPPPRGAGHSQGVWTSNLLEFCIETISLPRRQVESCCFHTNIQ